MTSSISPSPKLSPFSLALLEDSGWYQANYSNAKQLYFGRERGCDFIYGPCIDPKTKKSKFPEFCTTNQTSDCSLDSFHLARCVLVQRNDVPEAFNYFGDNSTGWDIFSDGCPTLRNFVDADCRNPHAYAPGDKGSDSRCFPFTFKNKTMKSSSIRCMKHHVTCSIFLFTDSHLLQCEYAKDGGPSLHIQMLDHLSVQCPKSGGNVLATKTSKYLICS